MGMNHKIIIAARSKGRTIAVAVLKVSGDRSSMAVPNAAPRAKSPRQRIEKLVQGNLGLVIGRDVGLKGEVPAA